MQQLLLALGPSLVLAAVVAGRRPGERVRLVAALLAGFLTGTLVLEVLPHWLALTRPDAEAEWLRALLLSWSRASLPEETGKLIALFVATLGLRARATADRDTTPGSARGALLRAGAFVGLGYAAFENLLHVSLRPDETQLVLLRAFTSLPAHALFGVIMGALAARGGARAWLGAWLAAMALHTTYDTPLLLLSWRASDDLRSWLAVTLLAVTLVGGWLWARHLARATERPAD